MRSLMIFIDGAYLRKTFEKFYGHDKIKYDLLSRYFVERVQGILSSGAFGNPGPPPIFLRAYYYDAEVEKGDKDYEKQHAYFETIKDYPGYEIKLGRLIRLDNGKTRQKGVDTLLAIDMVNKAHLNHYDVALLVAGDDDYLDLVKTVKETTGKIVCGAFDPSTASERLVKSFDQRITLHKNHLNDFIFQ